MTDATDLTAGLDAKELGWLMGGIGVLFIGGALIIQSEAGKELLEKLVAQEGLSAIVRGAFTLVQGSLHS